MTAALPKLPARFDYRLDLARYVTPRFLKDEPVHRWFYFPHSFSPQLVELLLALWKLPEDAVIIDPFVGAGTTLRSAQQCGFSAIGIDLSPLSVFVSRTKTRKHCRSMIRQCLSRVAANAAESEIDVSRSERLRKAFTDSEYRVLSILRQRVLEQSDQVSQFMLLGLLRVQQRVSRAKPDGGWFRWTERDCQAPQIVSWFAKTIEWMLTDLTDFDHTQQGFWEAYIGDARSFGLSCLDFPEYPMRCHAVITSPPYPNRHDYSRIFQIELLTLGLSEADIFDLRHSSLRSHVEARVPREIKRYAEPEILSQCIENLPDKTDPRIAKMLTGYFEDMNAVLESAYDILLTGGYVALVVGNVRHAGVMIPVDEILLSMGEAVGFAYHKCWVARLRGNSAQQMGKFGRQLSRESIIMLQKT